MSRATERDRGATPRIDGVVLAAGRSRRFGRSKPLLRLSRPPAREGQSGDSALLSPPEGGRDGRADEGETFLENVVRRLATGGCRSVTVVVAAGDEPVRRLARALDAVVVENPDPNSQPIDSVRLAIASLPPDSAAMLVLPVDIPLVATATVAALVDAFIAGQAPIVAPSHRGVLGHPVLIARPLFESILTQPVEQGLRSLLESRRDQIEAVQVDDPGTLIDIDTVDDYDTFIARAD